MVRDYIFSLISILKGESKLQTSKINENTYAVRCGYVNFFIYQKDKTYLSIDTGFNRKVIERELHNINIDPKSITGVLLTHSDYDHIGGINIFENANVYMSYQEMTMIETGRHRLFSYTKGSKQLSRIIQIRDKRILYFDRVKVECILTPGHTDGSMSFLMDDKYLFVGDTCRIKDGKVVPLQKYININTNKQIESIERLRENKNVEMIFVGHTGYKYGF